MPRRVLGLRCRECGAEYELQATHVCAMCFGPLDVAYDYDVIRRQVSRSRIEAGPPTMWRYRDLLPLEDDAPVVTLGEGLTPLVHAERLGAELGCDLGASVDELLPGGRRIIRQLEKHHVADLRFGGLNGTGHEYGDESDGKADHASNSQVNETGNPEAPAKEFRDAGAASLY